MGTPANRREAGAKGRAVGGGDGNFVAEIPRLRTRAIADTSAANARRHGHSEASRVELAMALGLATATAVIVFSLTLLNPGRPVIEVAMLDTAGGVRGAGTNQIAMLQARWKDVRQFSTPAELEQWERTPASKGSFARIIYDRTAGEVRVAGRAGGKVFSHTIPVEKNLGAHWMRRRTSRATSSGTDPERGQPCPRVPLGSDFSCSR